MKTNKMNKINKLRNEYEESKANLLQEMHKTALQLLKGSSEENPVILDIMLDTRLLEDLPYGDFNVYSIWKDENSIYFLQESDGLHAEDFEYLTIPEQQAVIEALYNYSE